MSKLGGMTEGFCGPVRLIVESNCDCPYEIAMARYGKPTQFSKSLGDGKYVMYDGKGSFSGDAVFNTNVGNVVTFSCPKAKMIQILPVNKKTTNPKKNVIEFSSSTRTTIVIS